MITQSTLASFYQLRNSGKLGKQEELVFRVLERNPKSSDNELAILTNLRINSITGRRNGLVKKGLVVCSGEKYNEITGTRNKVWEVTR